MSIDPRRIKNSRTAVRAVLNIMAHYGITLTNYKPVTCAQFLSMGIDVFLEDLDEGFPKSSPVMDVIKRLHKRPSQRKIAELFQHSLQRADLKSVHLSYETITLGDLENLSAQGERKAYRYTKIVGSQQFKAQLDQHLTIELQSILAFFGTNTVSFSVMLYHLTKHDLYSHFLDNYLVNLEDCPDLYPYKEASLYFAAKSFLLARKDIFDPSLRLLGSQFAPALQQFLQKQGVYRVNDWFPKASVFITNHLTTYINEQGGLDNLRQGDLCLESIEAAAEYHRFWYRHAFAAAQSKIQGASVHRTPSDSGNSDSHPKQQ